MWKNMHSHKQNIKPEGNMSTPRIQNIPEMNYDEEAWTDGSNAQKYSSWKMPFLGKSAKLVKKNWKYLWWAYSFNFS